VELLALFKENVMIATTATVKIQSGKAGEFEL
jgi:hypothetical protein